MKKTKKSVCAIILARSGSKGLKNKNIRDLAGKPLISHAIADAKNSNLIDRTIVSTDSNEIAEIANHSGADTPFLRPKEISDDLATSEDALLHTLNYLNNSENYYPEIIVYLQITEPFRPENIIDDCIQHMIDDNQLDSVFAGHIEHKNYWQKIDGKFSQISDKSQSSLPRQIKSPVFREDTGIMLATKSDVIRSGKRIGKKVKIIPYDHELNFIDIHSEFDLELSNLLMKKFTNKR